MLPRLRLHRRLLLRGGSRRERLLRLLRRLLQRRELVRLLPLAGLLGWLLRRKLG